MENLIELLNEYHHSNSDLIYYGFDKQCKRVYFHVELPKEQKEKLGDALFGDGIDEQRVGDEWLCSKKFGFIKWLVDNDKIKIPHELDELPQIYGVDYNSNECKSDRLIMLLSISNSPIEDLISYLR